MKHKLFKAILISLMMIFTVVTPVNAAESFSISMKVNDSKVKTWKSSDGTYYLFLPNNVNISKLSFKCSGITATKVSKGTINNGTITNAFTKPGDFIYIKSSTGNFYKVKVMQTKTASVMVDLNGVTLTTINRGSKDTKYKGNTVSIIDSKGNVSKNTEVEIKGRGNTTWIGGSKRPYQIKFDSKVSVLGMDKAKKWVLLANAFDETMLRNELVFQASESLNMRYTPEYEYANVWVDGTYIGTYMIGEKAEIGSGRLELNNQYGGLFELDDAYYKEEDYWFNSTVGHFTVKETVSDNEADILKTQSLFKNKLNSFLKFLESNPANSISLKELQKYIDVTSFANYFLINEYYSCPDAMISSAYFYMDGSKDVIHFGPVWDYDASMGNNKQGNSAYNKYNYCHSGLLGTLFNIPAFNNYVKAYYKNHKSSFSNAETNLTNIYSKIKADAHMNYTRWEYAFKPRNNNYRIKIDVKDFSKDYVTGVTTLKTWLSKRKSFFKVGTDASHSTMTRVQNTLVMRYTGDKKNIKMVAWLKDKGSSNSKWYTATKTASGYEVRIPVSSLGGYGMTYGAVYSGSTKLAMLSTIVMNVTQSPRLRYSLSSDHKKATLKVFNYTKAKQLKVAVWSNKNGQDVLKWYTMSKGSDDSYGYVVDLTKHKSNGTYVCDAYDGNKLVKRVTFVR